MCSKLCCFGLTGQRRRLAATADVASPYRKAQPTYRQGTVPCITVLKVQRLHLVHVTLRDLVPAQKMVSKSSCRGPVLGKGRGNIREALEDCVDPPLRQPKKYCHIGLLRSDASLQCSSCAISAQKYISILAAAPPSFFCPTVGYWLCFFCRLACMKSTDRARDPCCTPGRHPTLRSVNHPTLCNHAATFSAPVQVTFIQHCQASIATSAQEERLIISPAYECGRDGIHVQRQIQNVQDIGIYP